MNLLPSALLSVIRKSKSCPRTEGERADSQFHIHCVMLQFPAGGSALGGKNGSCKSTETEIKYCQGYFSRPGKL
jgi:hypothetical protein